MGAIFLLQYLFFIIKEKILPSSSWPDCITSSTVISEDAWDELGQAKPLLPEGDNTSLPGAHCCPLAAHLLQNTILFAKKMQAWLREGRLLLSSERKS